MTQTSKMSPYLPGNTDPGFLDLIEVYKGADIEFPQLKAMTLAQWALESGWGLSDLAMNNNNFAGMKWRKGMRPFGWAVTYKDWQGKVDPYVHFHDKAAFISGYWARFDIVSAYPDWRRHVHSGDAFIDYIGPIWVGMSPTHNEKYVKDIKRLCRNRLEPLLKT